MVLRESGVHVCPSGADVTAEWSRHNRPISTSPRSHCAPSTGYWMGLLRWSLRNVEGGIPPMLLSHHLPRSDPWGLCMAVGLVFGVRVAGICVRFYTTIR